MLEFDKAGRPVLDENGGRKVKTSHTLSPVPFILYDPHGRVMSPLRRDADAGLANVAATVAALLGLPIPDSWLPSLLA